jgi:hypothetical protein
LAPSAWPFGGRRIDDGHQAQRGVHRAAASIVARISSSTAEQSVLTNITNLGEVAESREQFFQQIEEEWTDLRRELVTHGGLRGERRSLLAVFMGIQLARTLKHSEQNNFICNIGATTAERPIPQDAVRQYLHDLDGSEPTSGTKTRRRGPSTD